MKNQTKSNLPWKIDYIYGYAYGKAVPQYLTDNEMFDTLYSEDEQDEVFSLKVGEQTTIVGVYEKIKITRMKEQS